MSYNTISDIIFLNNKYFNDEESHYFTSDSLENNDNNLSNYLYGNLEFESQIPSSDKRTNFDDIIEHSNSLKFDEYNNNLLFNNLNISQENNNIKNKNNKEEIIDNNLPELNEESNPDKINQIDISQENNIIQMDEEIEMGYDTKNAITQKTSEKKKIIKFSSDNFIRKVKHILLDCIIHFLNTKIRKLNNNKIGKGIAIKQFKNLNQKEKSNPNIQYNKDFINKTIYEILSEKISKRLSNFSPFHNKNLVENLLNDKKNSIEFKRLFTLTIFDYLNHFRGSEYYDILREMSSLDKELQKYQDEPDYILNLKYYFQNYENIINNKKSRKPKKNKENYKNI